VGCRKEVFITALKGLAAMLVTNPAFVALP